MSLSCSDNYEKIVLSMDRDFINSYDGIKSLYLIGCSENSFVGLFEDFDVNSNKLEVFGYDIQLTYVKCEEK